MDTSVDQFEVRAVSAPRAGLLDEVLQPLLPLLLRVHEELVAGVRALLQVVGDLGADPPTSGGRECTARLKGLALGCIEAKFCK